MLRIGKNALIKKKRVRRLWLVGAVTGLAVGLLFNAASSAAQAAPAGDSADAELRTNDVVVSPVLGINASLGYAAQHNSATGWANLLTPTASYRFNQHLSLDANLPWYLTVKSFVSTTSKGQTTYPLESTTDVLADLEVAGHLEAKRNDFADLFTAEGTFPTGNKRFGLGAGTPTWNITNHAEHSFGRFTPDLETGIGNSSTLANQAVRKAYVAVGLLANFQAGTAVDLPLGMDLDLEGYEQLPLGNQNIYGTVTKKGKNGKAKTTSVLMGTGAAEDNGFLAELTLPVGRHLALAGTYNRSLVQALDTASFGVTWTYKAPEVHSH